MKILNYLFEIYYSVKSAESGPMNRGANKSPASIPGPQQPWRTGIFSSYSLINKPYFRIAAFGIESRSLVTSCEPTLKGRISNSWFYRTFNSKLYLYYVNWFLFVLVVTFLFGFENICFKYYFSCIFTILLSSWPFLPWFRTKVYIRLLGIIGCFWFTFLNYALLIYLVQDFYNGVFPFSEENYEMSSLVSVLYNLFPSIDAYAEGIGF